MYNMYRINIVDGYFVYIKIEDYQRCEEYLLDPKIGLYNPDCFYEPVSYFDPNNTSLKKFKGNINTAFITSIIKEEMGYTIRKESD